MKHYAVAELTITDPSWIDDYVANVTAMVQRRGGRYLARTPRVQRIEGDTEPAQVMLIIEWPTRQAALDFYESEEYRPFRERRLAGAENRFLLIAGEDINGVAEIDP